MQRTFLKSKIHRACVTHSEVDYEGSIAIDETLMKAADIKEYERLEVYNVTNGERFNTYAIRAEANSGIVSVNGAAAHKAEPGDVMIICTYVELDEKELAGFKPKLVYVDEKNNLKRIGQSIPVQAA